jgi:hypothetical protein
VSGDDVRGSESRDAQQFPPAGATAARAAGRGDGQNAEIRWVGEQHRMAGYCGRAVVAGRATLAQPRPEEGRAAGAADLPRPVALLQRPRGTVVRIGPRPAAYDDEPAARAA